MGKELLDRVNEFLNIYGVFYYNLLGNEFFTPLEGIRDNKVEIRGRDMYVLEKSDIPSRPKDISIYMAAAAKQAGLNFLESFVQASSEVDRKDFLPDDFKDFAYEFRNPVPIDIGNHNCTALNMTAIMGGLGLQGIPEDANIAEIKSGNGYFSALLATSTKGAVVSYNVFSELNGLAEYNAGNSGLDIDNLTFVPHDETMFRLREQDFGKFDALVSRVELSMDDAAFFQQLLKKRGILVAPIRGEKFPCDTEIATERCEIYTHMGLCGNTEGKCFRYDSTPLIRYSAGDTKVMVPGVNFAPFNPQGTSE